MKYSIPASTRYVEIENYDGICSWDVYESDGTIVPVIFQNDESPLHPFELIAIGRILERHEKENG